MKHRVRNAALVVLMPLGLLILLGAACRAPAQADHRPVVTVVPAVQRETKVYKEWVGTVDGYTNAEIRPAAQGFLRARLYVEGSFVRKGDPLFELDSRRQREALEAARGRLARSEAVLAAARAGQTGLAPAAGLPDIDESAAGLQTAQAGVDAARAALEVAQLSLDATRVVSPIDGVAGATRAAAGDAVSDESVLTTISSVDPVKVLFYAGDDQPGRSGRAHPAGLSRTSSRRGERETLEIILPDGTLYAHRGDAIGTGRGGVTTGVFRNPERRLRPGQRVRVRAAMDVSDRALLIPVRAIFENDGVPLAAVVGPDGRVEYRSLRTAERIGGLQVIEQGLNAGDRVVVEGMRDLKPGTFVQPVAASAGEPPEPV